MRNDTSEQQQCPTCCGGQGPHDRGSHHPRRHGGGRPAPGIYRTASLRLLSDPAGSGHWALDTGPHWPPQHCRDWPQLQNNVASYLIFIRLQHLDGFASRTQPTAHNLTLFQIMIVITMRLVQGRHHTEG